MRPLAACGVLPVDGHDLHLPIALRKQHVVDAIVAVDHGLRPTHGAFKNLYELIANLLDHLGQITAKMMREHLDGGLHARDENRVTPKLIQRRHILISQPVELFRFIPIASMQLPGPEEGLRHQRFITASNLITGRRIPHILQDQQKVLGIRINVREETSGHGHRAGRC